MSPPDDYLVESRVAAGAMLLDAYYAKWHNDINVEKLDMASQQLDILGQLFGDYEIGFHELISRYKGPYRPFLTSDFGFNVPQSWQDEAGSKEATLAIFRRLDDAWKAEIIDRRAGKKIAGRWPRASRIFPNGVEIFPGVTLV